MNNNREFHAINVCGCVSGNASIIHIYLDNKVTHYFICVVPKAPSNDIRVVVRMQWHNRIPFQHIKHSNQNGNESASKWHMEIFQNKITKHIETEKKTAFVIYGAKLSLWLRKQKNNNMYATKILLEEWKRNKTWKSFPVKFIICFTVRDSVQLAHRQNDLMVALYDRTDDTRFFGKLCAKINSILS